MTVPYIYFSYIVKTIGKIMTFTCVLVNTGKIAKAAKNQKVIRILFEIRNGAKSEPNRYEIITIKLVLHTDRTTALLRWY